MNRLIVLMLAVLVAAPAAAQEPLAPLPSSMADGAIASPYPTTSSPLPIYALPAPAPTPTPEANVRVAAVPIASEPLPSPDLSAPSAVGLPDTTIDLTTKPLAGDAPCDEPLWTAPLCWLGPTPWDSGIELGLNGSGGSSDSMSIRTGGYIKRESRFSKLDLSAYYNNTSSDGTTTQNNAELDVRNDWLLDDSSPWTLFATGTLFYDEFQAFDIQINGQSGIGYRVVDLPDMSLITRLGAGASRELGGPDEEWVPESLVGFEYDRQVCATQKLFGKLDYFPSWEDVSEYRMVAEVGWEIELVQPSNLSLKISANDRYDSTIDETDPHLMNYSVLLLLKL